MKAFLSSTYMDLVKYREAATDALERLGQQVGRMEVFGARPEEPARACLQEIEDCHIFVGIYAHRYGYVPKGSDLSITELEFDHAKKHLKPIFCFVVDENHPWPPKMIEAGRGKSKLLKFKDKIGVELVRDTFTTPADLAARLATAIGRHLVERQSRAAEDAHAYALNVSVSRDQNLFRLWVANRGTHLIRDIEINAIPDAEDWHETTHGCLPRLQQSEARGVEVIYPILGGWFHAKVTQLNPNRGLMVASFQIEHGDYTRIDIDAFWNDQAGMQRKNHVVVDVASVTGDLPLKPRR